MPEPTSYALSNGAVITLNEDRLSSLYGVLGWTDVRPKVSLGYVYDAYASFSEPDRICINPSDFLQPCIQANCEHLHADPKGHVRRAVERTLAEMLGQFSDYHYGRGFKRSLARHFGKWILGGSMFGIVILYSAIMQLHSAHPLVVLGFVLLGGVIATFVPLRLGSMHRCNAKTRGKEIQERHGAILQECIAVEYPEKAGH